MVINIFKMNIKSVVVLSFILSFFICNLYAQNPMPRIIVTADPELDDNNSLIRFLLYSSDMNVEGLIYASSAFHWKGDGKGTKYMVPGREYDRFGLQLCPCTSWRWREDESFIHDAVDAYEQSYSNLKTHNTQYPTPQNLRSVIRYGNIEFDGDISKDSPGSDLIKSTILDDKPGQLFITAWGGASTIARALKSIKEQYEFSLDWEKIKNKIDRKVILLLSGDQDDTYTSYIKPNWPKIESRVFSDGPNYGYGAQINASKYNAPFLTSSWMKENVIDKGSLGKLYRVWGDGKQMVKGDIMDYFGMSGFTNEALKQKGYIVWLPVQEKNSWLGEGDNHTFMNMLGNGLNAYEAAHYGGWGGVGDFKKNVADIFAMPSDTSADAMAKRISASNDATKSIDVIAKPNFFPSAQNDFANRLKWATTAKYKDANHEPIVNIENAQNVLAIAGQKIRLNGLATDPDGDTVNVKWWQYDVGTYKGKVEITNANQAKAELTIPKDVVEGQTIHLIFEANDNGSPSLNRYKRMIITIKK